MLPVIKCFAGKQLRASWGFLKKWATHVKMQWLILSDSMPNLTEAFCQGLKTQTLPKMVLHVYPGTLTGSHSDRNGWSAGNYEHWQTIFIVVYFLCPPFLFPSLQSSLPLFLPPFLLFLLHEPILGTHKVNSYWTPRPEVFFSFFCTKYF